MKAAILELARDVGFRLGYETQIQETHSCATHETNYALAFHEMSLEQVKELLAWLDYYVPTLDEQKAIKSGPMGSEDDAIPRRRKGRGGVVPQAAPADELARRRSVNLVLESYGENKIAVIKVVKDYFDMHLSDAKKLVESVPSTLLQDQWQHVADELRRQLEAAGAAVKVVAS